MRPTATDVPRSVVWTPPSLQTQSLDAANCYRCLTQRGLNSAHAADTVTRCGLLLQMSHIAWSEPQLPHAASVFTTSLALHSTQHTHSVTFEYNFLLLNKESTSKAHSIVISRPSWKIICSRCQSLISRSRQQHWRLPSKCVIDLEIRAGSGFVLKWSRS